MDYDSEGNWDRFWARTEMDGGLMSGKFSASKFVWMFEVGIVTALHVLIMVSVLVATVILFVLLAQNVLIRAFHIREIGDLLPAMQTTFAGVLIVLLGLELAETLKAYFTDHEIRVEVILIVAITAVGRHMIQIDFSHASPNGVFGLAALMLSLTVGYFFVKKGQSQSPSAVKSESNVDGKQK
jgi:uncharacterized membrane protein (DUF373 family)